MPELQISHFRQFFFELHNRNPFPWQETLTERVCTTGWPEVIDLPTASGKTACIDIALFALALRESEIPRRIFFVVDRRVVVSEAYLRAKDISERLGKTQAGILGEVAARLSNLGGKDKPLSVYEMRGGAFRDETWIRNPLQPLVIASTVDQVGSRLLFRGYGVSENSWPLHAGLIANDALIILDEAHCSRAFAQTLQRIKEYRGEDWAADPIRSPFRVVEMTATPSESHAEPFRISDADRTNEVFKKRLYASKPVRLVECKCKKDDVAKFADELISQAVELKNEARGKRVAIVVNRVRMAKEVYRRLREVVKDASVELVIGRMRGIDRDDLYQDHLSKIKSDVSRHDEDPLTFVISTQCLEVGADLDFDVLVSECASIDALMQRFGRLDRLGAFGRARGAIVIASWQTNPNQPDPVYKDALLKTWNWLIGIGGQGGVVNMGIEAAADRAATIAQLLPPDSEQMRLLGENAPILLPAHLDSLVQTNPAPEPDPLIELFLHGPKRGVPDVQVVWRADLDGEDPDRWQEIVALCPPSSPEAMPVQIDVFKRWFAGQKNADERESDLPIGTEDADDELDGGKGPGPALVWQAERSYVIGYANLVKPGQTLVLPVSAKGWEELGHKPDNAREDVGDRAAFRVRRGVSLRLHPKLTEGWPEEILDYLKTPDVELKELESLLLTYRDHLRQLTAWRSAFLEQIKKLGRKRLNTYPTQQLGYVLEARKRKAESKVSDGPVPLKDHLDDVRGAVEKFAAEIEEPLRQALLTSAKFHDYGKTDIRYQAWLLGGDLLASRFLRNPIAKSGNDRLGKQTSVGLPEGFRHELLSLMFAAKSPDVDGAMRDLILHLIATHHGRCRPFAPVILDDAAECVSYEEISVCKQERIENALHRLDSGVPDRFWTLTRKYGWWGLAYLEAILRLADWDASQAKGVEVSLYE